ncbi:MHYT domain-containing protein [Reinekea marina]|uniref:MHYT domain-containing protein n=1 Tax=Reinekea marina TaxID=1310421 RepID=A0ABV7WPR6_9GAMM|nr:MHYT domain-containing protein [Reinekea marina]MDN3650431.1 MHYT domain-containing protein [Reinekea marina]
MNDSYDLTLVFASYCVAVIASFAAIYFSGRVRSLKSGFKSFSFFAGALCLGGGIWSMHFVGMSAYHTNFEMTFDVTWTVFSFVVALIASGLGLWVITLEKVSLFQLAGSALLVGMGVFAMHYSGMIAMQMSPGIIYNIPLVILSGIIAVAASFAALLICRNIELVPVKYSLLARLSAALIMGIAVCGMHYTGMSAVTFLVGAICSAENTLRGNWMGVPTAVASSVFLLLLVYIAYQDYRAIERSKREQEARDAAVMKSAFIDASSGLPNRSSLEKHLERLLVEKAGQPSSAFDIIYVELSDYRTIVRTKGEETAQNFAKQFARILERSIPENTFLARYNTNGFVAVLPESGLASLKQSARILSEKLLQTSAGKIANIHVRFGLGYSQYPQSGTLPKMLIRQAQVIKLRQQPTLQKTPEESLA